MNVRTAKRTARKPLHQRGPQSIHGEKGPNFVYRFVNDTGSRLHNFEMAGYEMVTGDELTVGDTRVADASNVGSGKRVISNDGTVSFLMRIKKEFYDEDQAAKATQLAEQEAAMKPNASQGMDYGSLKVSRD